MSPADGGATPVTPEPDRPHPSKPGRLGRFVRRLLFCVVVLLVAGEVVVRLLGLDPPPIVEDADVVDYNNVRRHVREYPAAKTRLAQTTGRLAELQNAKADPNEIQKASDSLKKAEDEIAWQKAHWPRKKFRFRGYWPGMPMEFEQEIELNDLWLRDFNYEPNKPSNVRRVVVLGDSYTTAWEVGFDEMYHKRLARELTQLAGPDRKVEVPAFALPSMGLADLKREFLDRAMSLKPDVLALVVAGTLMSENYKILQKELDVRFGRLVGVVIPEARGVESRWLLIKHSALNRLVARLAAGFYVLHLDWFKDLEGRNPIDPSVATFFEPTPPKWQEAWEATLATLREYNETCRKAGIPLLVIMMPTEEAINSIFAQPATGYRIDWTKVDRKFEAMCRQVGCDFLSMTPDFKAYREKHGRDYRPMYDIHWNAKGHELACQIIFQRLRTKYARELGLTPLASGPAMANK
jgi:hypothetical protein